MNFKPVISVYFRLLTLLAGLQDFMLRKWRNVRILFLLFFMPVDEWCRHYVFDLSVHLCVYMCMRARQKHSPACLPLTSSVFHSFKNKHAAAAVVYSQFYCATICWCSGPIYCCSVSLCVCIHHMSVLLTWLTVGSCEQCKWTTNCIPCAFFIISKSGLCRKKCSC